MDFSLIQNFVLRRHILSRLPLPKLECPHELKALEDIAMVVAVTMFYHTGTLHFFAAEEALGGAPDFSRPFLRFLAPLKGFLLSVIRVSFY